MGKQLMDFFNKQPRLGVLATADKNGKVNAAYFNSPQMTDDTTVLMGIGKNRSFENLQQNPNAVFIILEPGKSLPEWKGVRVYLKVTESETSGAKVDGIRAAIAKAAGEKPSKMIHAAITFKIEEIRPLADFGQGWEQSI
jgi:hypothetical protein